jgi:hypothetical protein
MTNKGKLIDIPNLRVNDVRLLSASYRIKDPKIPSDVIFDGKIEGSIQFRVYARTKRSFKVRATQQIIAGAVIYRARHEARFNCDSPLAPEILESQAFQNKVANYLLPFASELFSFLTGKSFTVPIVSPGKIGFEEE